MVRARITIELEPVDAKLAANLAHEATSAVNLYLDSVHPEMLEIFRVKTRENPRFSCEPVEEIVEKIISPYQAHHIIRPDILYILKTPPMPSGNNGESEVKLPSEY